MKHAFAVGVAMLCVLCVSSAADAAAPWSATIETGPPSAYVSASQVGFGTGGSGLAGWQIMQPAGSTALSVSNNYGNHGRLASIGADGTVGVVHPISDTIAAGPAVFGTGAGLVLRLRQLPVSQNSSRSRLSWSNVSASGVPGPPHRLTVANLAYGAALACRPDGLALAAWTELVRGVSADPPSKADRYVIRYAWKQPGRAFSSPQTLFVAPAIEYEHSGGVRVAMNQHGKAVITFADNREHRGHSPTHRVLAWVRTSPAGFGRPLLVGLHDGDTRLAPAVTDTGRIYVAWGSQDGGEEANHPWVVKAASLAPHARHFGATQTLDPGSGVERPIGDVHIASGPGSRATVAWSGVGGATSPTSRAYPLKVAASSTTGRFALAQTLAVSGAVGGLAVGRAGAAVVTWASVGEYTTTLQPFAAIRPAGATTFGTAETIDVPDLASPPTVAINPMTARPFATWAARPDGVDPMNGVTQTAVLSSSLRAPIGR